MKASGKSSNTILLIVAAMLIMGITSCFDDKYDFNNISDEIQLNPGISAPLAFGSLTLEDILNEVDSTGDYVKHFEDDSLLYIIYSENLVSYKGSEIVSIPDQNFIQLFIDSDVATAGILSVPVNDTATVTKEQNGEFLFSKGEKIDSMNLKKVVMHFDVTSSFHHKGFLIIYSDSILVGGEKYRKEIQISEVDGSFVSIFDDTLTNVKLILDNSDPVTTYLPIKFQLNLINSGELVLPTENCDVKVSLRNIDFSSMFGYLGQYELLAANGEIDLTIFNENKDGNLFFADPRLTLAVNNSYGIPAELELKDVISESKINNSSTPLTFNGVNPFEIAAPSLENFGQKLHSEIPINKDNSNIDEVMQSLPHHLYYSAVVNTNAMGPSGPYNFVTDTSEIDVDVEIILPLWIKAEGFTLSDTADFDFKKQIGSDVDQIDYFRLSMDVTNGLPVEVDLEVSFADSSKTTLGTLFRDGSILLEAAEVGPDEKVTLPVNNLFLVEYTAEEIEKIKTSKYIIVKASANTPASGTGYFKFYSSYGIDFKLGAKVDFNINSNDF